VTNKDNRNLQL